jgi:hypothetical protein
MARYHFRPLLAWLIAVPLAVGFLAAPAFAEVNITDRGVVVRHQRSQAQKMGDKHHGFVARSQGMTAGALATGSVTLIDAGGLEYYINDNITFSTSSSASGAMSEASYTHAVAATTSGGGTTSSTLNDAFDGYNTLCVSLTNATGTCETGNSDYVIYNKNGASSLECNGRQVVFNTQTVGQLQMYRKVFVPTNDTFARWMNIFTNTGGTTITFNAIIANNLGSDSNTRIVSSSNGNNTAEVTDTWISSFQEYSAGTSSDPRLGHVFQGIGAATPLAFLNFVDGDDNPWWGYHITLLPGQTKMIVNFVTGQPSKAAANAKAAELVGLPPNSLGCMSIPEQTEMVNFAPSASAIPTLGPMALLLLAGFIAVVGILLIVRLRIS